jgi:stress response protein YsnF
MDDSQSRTPEVVRHEERLDVGTQRVPVERVRFGKRVVTEERVVTVSVRREEFFLEQVPVGADATGDATGTAGVSAPTAEGIDPTDAVADLVLYEEQAEIVTRVVPRERVRVRLDRSREEVAVAAELAREVVEVDQLDIGHNSP